MNEINAAVEAVAQALFDRTVERCAARGWEPHHKAGTLVRDMPPSYRDDYLDDARAALRASGDWNYDTTEMPNDGRFEVLRRYPEVFRHLPTEPWVIEPQHGRMFVPIAWRHGSDDQDARKDEP